MEVTREKLLQVMPTARNRIDKFLVYINRYAPEFFITTPLRMAHYLAQIAHESAELKYTKELASGAKYDTGKLAITLGNTPVADGDGQRYKGRGLIQLTGKANYKAYKKYCGFDVVAKPELLELPLGAVRSSMWFWQTHGLNNLADKDDVKAVTKRINGGYNGLSSRTKYLARAKKALGLTIILFLTVFFFSGCKNKEYVTVEKTTTDTLYKYRVRVDSVVKFDSITTLLKDDTVFSDRWHTLHVYHTEVDTVYRIKTVKEPQPYPVIKPVEVNKLYWWQNLLMWAGSLYSLICIVYGIINIYRLKRNMKS